MPPVVLAAGITAAGALGGAALASRSSNKAASLQAESTDKAMAFQREQAAKQDAYYKMVMDIWNGRQQALAQHLGVSVPGISGLESGALPVNPMTAPSSPVQGMTIRELVQNKPELLGEWEKFNRFGA